MAEYTDDAVSGRSILSKFRHLKDWVVAKVTSNDDRLDTIEDTLEHMVDEGVRDVQISKSVFGNTTSVRLTVTDKDGNVTTQDAAMITKDATSESTNDALSASAVKAFLGDTVNTEFLGRVAYDTGYTSNDQDPIRVSALAYSVSRFNTDGAISGKTANKYGIPLCELSQGDIVMVTGTTRIPLNEDYASKLYIHKGDDTITISGTTYPLFSSDVKSLWNIDDDKYYLTVEWTGAASTAAPANSGAVFGIVLGTASTDGAKLYDPIIYQPASNVSQLDEDAYSNAFVQSKRMCDYVGQQIMTDYSDIDDGDMQDLAGSVSVIKQYVTDHAGGGVPTPGSISITRTGTYNSSLGIFEFDGNVYTSLSDVYVSATGYVEDDDSNTIPLAFTMNIPGSSRASNVKPIGGSFSSGNTYTVYFVAIGLF